MQPEGEKSAAPILREMPARSVGERARRFCPDEAASVVEIKQEFLPVMLTEVNGKKAKIRPVDGEEYSVAIGDQLKGLDYQGDRC